MQEYTHDKLLPLALGTNRINTKDNYFTAQLLRILLRRLKVSYTLNLKTLHLKLYTLNPETPFFQTNQLESSGLSLRAFKKAARPLPRCSQMPGPQKIGILATVQELGFGAFGVRV